MEILKLKIIGFYTLLTGLFLLGCDSPDALDCFQKSGKSQLVIIDEVPQFSTLILEDNINLTLVESDSNYIELDYYENLIPEIHFRSEGDSITFYNKNSCKFVRDYNPPRIIFHSNLMEHKIISYSSGEINNQDLLNKSITIVSEDISGMVNLNLDNSTIMIQSNSTTNFKLQGKTDKLIVRNYFNDGQMDCFDLISKEIDVLQRGYNDLSFHVTEKLSGSIENAGRILYKGNPAIVEVEVTGGGALIKIDK